MFPHERRAAIVALARTTGRVGVIALAAKLDVTPETVRRDLSELERSGVLRRVHGGAVPVERFAADRAIAERVTAQREEKARIAEAALAEVPTAGSILLDAGSTTGALADRIPAGRELTVVTNDLLIAHRLAADPGLTIMTVGGRVRSVTMSMVDAWAVRALADVVVDVAFLGTNGFSAERGVTTPDPAEAEVKGAMVRAGRRVVLLADHTKAGNDCFARFAALDAFDVVITDAALDDETAQRLESTGPQVVRA